MRQICIYKDIKGFIRLYNYGYKHTRMITKKASERMRIILFWKTHGLKATKDAFKVSRSSLFAWQQAYRVGGRNLVALNPGIQKRHTQQRRAMDCRIVAEIRRLRLMVCPNMGKDKVKIFLDIFCQEQKLKSISASTIGRVIKDKKIFHHRIKVTHFGKIKMLRKPKEFISEAPGDLIEIDTVVRFIAGIRRYVITAVDVSSRYTFAWSYKKLDSANARDFFKRLEIAFPYSIRHVQTDNGTEFCKYFTSYLTKRKKVHFWNYKGQPYKNGHIEKYNRTIQEEFIDQHEVLLYEPRRFNERVIDYLLWYNTKRPHWSLKLQSPVNHLLITNNLSRMRWTDTGSLLFFT
jgi:transposase InsO family protein